MASAVWRIRSSLTLQANLFQLFQPICGERARSSNFCALAGPKPAMLASRARRAAIRRRDFIEWSPWLSETAGQVSGFAGLEIEVDYFVEVAQLAAPRAGDGT